MDLVETILYVVATAAVACLLGGLAGWKRPVWSTAWRLGALAIVLPVGLMATFDGVTSAGAALVKVVLEGTTGRSVPFGAKFSEYFGWLLSGRAVIGVLVVVSVPAFVSGVLAVWIRRRISDTAKLEIQERVS